MHTIRARQTSEQGERASKAAQEKRAKQHCAATSNCSLTLSVHHLGVHLGGVGLQLALRLVRQRERVVDLHLGHAALGSRSRGSSTRATSTEACRSHLRELVHLRLALARVGHRAT